MVEMRALLCSESENMRKLADMLTKNGVSVKVCPAEPLDILQECMTQPPFAVLIEEGAFEYRELVRKYLRRALLQRYIYFATRLRHILIYIANIKIYITSTICISTQIYWQN